MFHGVYQDGQVLEHILCHLMELDYFILEKCVSLQRPTSSLPALSRRLLRDGMVHSGSQETGRKTEAEEFPTKYNTFYQQDSQVAEKVLQTFEVVSILSRPDWIKSLATLTFQTPI